MRPETGDSFCPDWIGKGRYTCRAPWHNQDSYDIYSCGPDNMTHVCTEGYKCYTMEPQAWCDMYSGESGDDINNWLKW